MMAKKTVLTALHTSKSHTMPPDAQALIVVYFKMWSDDLLQLIYGI